ncbi:phosphocarrier protein [Litorimonas taeanensis]|uniref:Phosphocarrier protein n=1 Tax=Litorimonas taeanensis TaxID=568099 RepID=A0A420WIR0_9PROT|nr:HPr family phosphocarrier protein [Litorimonas taeanensis]RKQ70822.1 phosphocarrier protein [Litorimonas taeanensis]
MSQTAQITLTLTNKRGLHARASNKFMETVMQFQSQVWVRSHNDVCAERVEADSVMELLLLGAACNEDITVTAQGKDAPETIQAIADLVKDRFGEED